MYFLKFLFYKGADYKAVKPELCGGTYNFRTMLYFIYREFGYKIDPDCIEKDRKAYEKYQLSKKSNLMSDLVILEKDGHSIKDFLKNLGYL